MSVLPLKFIMSSIIVIGVNAICCSNGIAQNTSFNDWANFQKYASENAKLPPKAESDHRVVFMGNSITEFWKPTDSTFFTGRQYINRGISGQTTPQMLLRFRQDVIDLKPSVVVILAGINDIAENTGPIALEDVFGNIVSMVELAEANNIKVVLCAILPAAGFYWNPVIKPADKVIELNTMIQAYARGNDIPYADYYSPMVNNEKGLKAEYSDDAVHPNLAGYKAMEPIVEKAIAEALRNKLTK